MVLQRNRNQNLTEIENRRRSILFLCDGFRKTDLGIGLIAIAFRGSIQNRRLFSIFSSFIFCSIIYQFEKRTGLILANPQRIVLIIHYLYSNDGFTYGHSNLYKMLLVRLHRSIKT